MIIFALMLTTVALNAKEKEKRKVASSHHCVADALKRAPKLFKLQTPAGQTIVDKESVSVSEEDRTIFDTRIPYDVIQIQVLDGNSPYQLKFLYQKDIRSCNLMGQEILDSKNPY